MEYMSETVDQLQDHEIIKVVVFNNKISFAYLSFNHQQHAKYYREQGTNDTSIPIIAIALGQGHSKRGTVTMSMDITTVPDRMNCDLIPALKNKDGIVLSIVYAAREPVLTPTILRKHAAAKSSN